MKTKFLVFILFFIFLELSVLFDSAFAVAPVILSFPPSIINDSQFSLQATMSGLSAQTTYRLRIALSQSGTTNYFGSTYNGSDWYNGTPSPIDYSKFLTITTDQDGSWNGDVLGKFESGDSNYKNTGSGSYDLKLGRYTQNGSSATWSNTASVNLTAPSATPTNAPTPKPTATDTTSPKPQITNTPTPTKYQTLSNNSVNTTSFQVNDKKISPAQNTKEVLGESTKPSPADVEKSKQNVRSENISPKDNALIPKILIILGTIFLLLCGIVIFYPFIKNIIDEKFNE